MQSIYMRAFATHITLLVADPIGKLCYGRNSTLLVIPNRFIEESQSKIL